MNYHPPSIAPSALDERQYRQWCYVVVINDTQTKHALHFPTFRVALSLDSCHFYPHSHSMPFLSARPRSPRSFSWGIPSQTSRVPHHAARCKDLGRWSHGEKRVGFLDWKLPEVENTPTFLLINSYFDWFVRFIVHFHACFGLNSGWTVPVQIESTDSVAIFKRYM